MSTTPPDPVWSTAIADARTHLATGRPDLALARLDRAIDDPAAPVDAVRLCASALRAQNLNAAARPLLERLVRASPASAVAEHNLAAALGDLGDVSAAAQAAQRAIDKGGQAPETWLVLGRALQGLGRIPEAEAAYGRSLSLRPGQVEARRDLAQLIWMRTGDPAAAMRLFDTEATPAELHPSLVAVGTAALMDMAGARAAYDWLAPMMTAAGGDRLHLAAARAAGRFDPRLALDHAEAAVRASPGSAEARMALATALMGCDRAAEALPMLDAHLRGAPLDQYAIALRYTAWRVLSDPRALGAGDYAALIQGYDLSPAEPGTDPTAWMSDVATSLRRLHAFRTHPFDQSIREGIQAPIDPRWAGDPVLDAVFAALGGPIDAYVEAMAGRSDPMSRRASSAWDITGAWSVQLRAGGRHADHVHPRGWVSSALHVATLPADPAEPRAGWLRFGAVDLGPGLQLEAEHWEEPRSGRVVLFPSWMWHGTEPFTGGGERLTIAFDVQPR